MIPRIASADRLRLLLLPIALVVTPRPQIVRRRLVGGPSQIAQHPHRGPQPSNVRLPRQNDVHFHNAPGETELVPTLNHPAFEMLGGLRPFLLDVIVMIPGSLLDERADGEHPVRGGRDGAGVVEVEGSAARGGVVVVGFVEGRPHGVVAVGEGAIGDVEFVGHDEVVGGAVDEGGGGEEVGGRVFVDPVGGGGMEVEECDCQLEQAGGGGLG
mmetsp:Transcript_25876/g.53507  ORF Transcript_25876/g.53507 Transcript_25876/m.53507 type:complete len:213 (-) Transcript_25876:132-770(-)